MRFQDIPDLLPIKQRLVQALDQGKVAHAQLFHGPEGGAGLAMALAYTAYLFCTQRHQGDACGTCPSCQKVHKGVHPDLIYLFPTLNNGKIKDFESDLYLKEWRSFILESPYFSLADWTSTINEEGNKQAIIPILDIRKLAQKISLKPYEAKLRVVLIWHPESLNPSAANALLKSLEEPPSQTIFLLVCHQPDQLLATILSRTQRVYIPPVAPAALAQHLMQSKGMDETLAWEAVQQANGNLALALQSGLGEDLRLATPFAEWMRAVYSGNIGKLMLLADQFDKSSKEEQKGLLTYALHVMRQCLYQGQGAEDLVHGHEKERAFIRNFAPILQAESISKISAALSKAQYHLERNARAKMLHFMLSIKMIPWLKKN